MFALLTLKANKFKNNNKSNLVYLFKRMLIYKHVNMFVSKFSLLQLENPYLRSSTARNVRILWNLGDSELLAEFAEPFSKFF